MYSMFVMLAWLAAQAGKSSLANTAVPAAAAVILFLLILKRRSARKNRESRAATR